MLCNFEHFLWLNIAYKPVIAVVLVLEYISVNYFISKRLIHLSFGSKWGNKLE